MNIQHWSEEQRVGYLKRLARKEKRQRRIDGLKRNLEKFKETGTNAGKIRDAYIYIIENTAFPNWYKIGTCVNIESRLSTYQTSDPLKGYVMKDKWMTKNRFDVEKVFLAYAEESDLFDVKGEWVYTTDYKTLKKKLLNFVQKPKLVARQINVV